MVSVIKNRQNSEHLREMLILFKWGSSLLGGVAKTPGNLALLCKTSAKGHSFCHLELRARKAWPGLAFAFEEEAQGPEIGICTKGEGRSPMTGQLPLTPFLSPASKAHGKLELQSFSFTLQPSHHKGQF